MKVVHQGSRFLVCYSNTNYILGAAGLVVEAEGIIGSVIIALDICTALGKSAGKITEGLVVLHKLVIGILQLIGSDIGRIAGLFILNSQGNSNVTAIDRLFSAVSKGNII